VWNLLKNEAIHKPTNTFRAMKIFIKLGDSLWFDNLVSIPDCTTVVSPRLTLEGTAKLIFLIPTNPWLRNWKQTNRHFLARGDYSSIANYRANFPLILWGICGTFLGISKFLFIYSTISRGTPNNVPWSPGWKTLLYNFRRRMSGGWWLGKYFEGRDRGVVMVFSRYFPGGVKM